MRKAASYLLIPLLLFVVWILVLNLNEADYYPGALLTPPPEPINGHGPGPYVPLQFTHPCACGNCIHVGRIVENHVEYDLIDEDGWYRLWWSAPEHYYYDELPMFLQGLEEPTATRPAGRWKIRIEYNQTFNGPRPHSCCEAVPILLELDYELEMSGADPEAETFSDETGFLRIGKRFGGFIRDYEARLGASTVTSRYYGVWKLKSPPRIEVGPCVCPRGY